MPKYVKVGDKYVSFPDDMSQEDIQQVLTSQFSEEKTATTQVKTEPTRELSIGEQIGAGIDDTTAMWKGIYETVKELPGIATHLPSAIYEQFTGSERRTKETEEAIPHTLMPTSDTRPFFEREGNMVENFVNALSGASKDLFIDMATLGTPPEEMADILVASSEANVTKRKDDKGNIFLKHPDYEKEFAIRPGFRLEDVPGPIIEGMGVLGITKLINWTGRKMLNLAAKEGAKSLTQKTLIDKGKEALKTGGIESLYETGKQITEYGLGGDPLSAVEPLTAGLVSSGFELLPKKVTQDLLPEREKLDIEKSLRETALKGDETQQDILMETLQPQSKLFKAEAKLGTDLPAQVFPETTRGKRTLTSVMEGSGEAVQESFDQLKRSSKTIMNQLQDKGAFYVKDSPDLLTFTNDMVEKLKRRRDDYDEFSRARKAEIDPVVDPSIKSFPQNTYNYLIKLRRDNPNTISPELKTAIRQMRLLGKGVGTKYTLGDINNFRKKVGESLKNPMSADSITKMIPQEDKKKLYAALREDQNLSMQKNYPDIYDSYLEKVDADSKSLSLSTDIDEFMVKKNAGDTILNILKKPSKGAEVEFNQLMSIVPPEDKKEFLMTAIAQNSSKPTGEFDFSNFSKFYDNLKKNRIVHAEVKNQIGLPQVLFLRRLDTLSKEVDKTEKIFKDLKPAPKKSIRRRVSPKGFSEKMFTNLIVRSLVGYGAGQAIGGGVGGAIGASVAIMGEALRGASNKKLEEIGDFITGTPMKNLLRESAYREPSEKTVKALTKSKSFDKIWDSAKMEGGEVAKRAFIRSLLQVEDTQENK